MSSSKQSRITRRLLTVALATLIGATLQPRSATASSAMGLQATVADLDDDGVADAIDNCPRIWNPDQATANASSIGTACDLSVPAVTATTPANGAAKHQTYSGATVTLAAAASGGVNQYMWDFGDGSAATAWTAIVNPFNLGINHVYSGAPETDFIATVRVRHTSVPAVIYEASFSVVVKVKTLDVESALAIERGLWFLHTTLSRGTYAAVAPGNAMPYGTFSQNVWYDTAAARAFVAQGHKLTGANRLTDPYNDDIIRLANYLLVQVSSATITNQVHAGHTDVPDTNANTYGLRVGASGELGTYHDGFMLDLLVHIGPPAWTAATGAVTRVAGRQLRDIAQDFVDWIAYAQADAGYYRGGWQYTSNSQSADNSTSMYPATGLLAAREMTSFGLTIPAFVISENAFWTNASQNLSLNSFNGSFGYQGPTDCGALGPAWYQCTVDTSSGILQMMLQGVTAAYPNVQKALTYLGNNWGYVLSATVGGSAGLTTYPSYAALKALRHVGVTTLTHYGNSFDWYNTDGFVAGFNSYPGLRRRLVSQQAANGSWLDTAGNAGLSSIASTSLAVIMLSADDYIVSSTSTADDLNTTYDGSARVGTGTCTNSAPGSAGSYQSNGSAISGTPTDAGTYTFVWSCPGDSNHTASSDTGAITIAKAPTTTSVVFAAAPYVYTGASFTASATVSGAALSLTEAVTYTGDCTNVTAGGCSAASAFAGDANHAASSGSASITILKSETTVALDCSSGAPFTYSGAAITPCIATATGDGTLTAAVSAVTYIDNVNAGTATASAFYPGDANHNESPAATATFAIAKAAPVVTVAGETVTYDGQPHGGICTVAGVNGAVLTGSSSYAPGTTTPVAAGAYTLTCAFAGSNNYSAASDSAAIAIGKAAATVTAGSGTKVFGTADPVLTPASSGFLAVDSITVMQDARDAGESVGAYATHASAGGPGISNYAVQSINGNLQITRATPVVTVMGAAIPYDGEAHAGACTVAGVNGDALTGVPSYAPGPGAPVSAGAYTLTCSFAGNGNYEPAANTATITINKVTATVTAGSGTKVFGASDPVLTPAVSGFLAGDAISVSQVARDPGENVGSYATHATAGGAALGNYEVTFVDGGLAITKAPLSVTANDITRSFGVANPPLTATITGFVAGQTAAALGGTLSVVTTATQFSALGTYPIVPSGLTSSNYAIAFVNGTLTINNTAPVCTAAAPSIATIWSPNHQWVPVTVTGVTDAEGDSLAIKVVRIFQDEPVNSGGSGNTTTDGAGIGTSTAQVRAERAGTGNGRVYHITFTATDTVGASCTKTVKVSVPHSQNGVTAVDGGPLFDSTIPVAKK